MPEFALDYHRLKTPIDHPDLSVTRGKLEYSTVDVPLVYLLSIGKSNWYNHWGDESRWALLTNDSFTDKAVECIQIYDGTIGCIARLVNISNEYITGAWTGYATSDFRIRKMVNGALYDIASEAVDLSHIRYRYKLSCLGSTLKGYRDDMTTPKIVATDTSFASGKYGGGDTLGSPNAIHLSVILRVASSIFQQAQVILEVDVDGAGNNEAPYIPKLIHSFTQDGRDLNAITWGAFEFNDESATNIIMVYGDNPYKSGAIQRQIDYAKSKNLRVFTTPKDYGEAVSIYNKLKGDFNHWLAGKDNFAYQVFGWEVLDLLQGVDFYYGELLEHKTHYDQLKQVQDWELRNRFNELKYKLSRVNVLVDERDKHLDKLNKILKVGW